MSKAIMAYQKAQRKKQVTHVVWLVIGFIVLLNTGYLFFLTFKQQDIAETLQPHLVSYQQNNDSLNKALITLQNQVEHLQQQQLAMQSSIPFKDRLLFGQATFQDRLKRTNQLGPHMVLIPAIDNFTIGNDIQDELAGEDEVPRSGIQIAQFAISQYEITVHQFNQFVQQTDYQESPANHSHECKKLMQPLHDQQPTHPVVCVTWHDAMAYVQWLSEETGQIYRLPTEAEWEYAARGGTRTQYWWGNEAKNHYANCKNCGNPWDGKSTAPVGSFTANGFGLYDVAGNVWEWTCSYYTDKYSGQETRCGVGEQLPRTLRGGSWVNPIIRLKASNRNNIKPLESSRYSMVGFRVVSTLAEKP
jgi:formylglycine-generating enzyme required for sulfatase activity